MFRTSQRGNLRAWVWPVPDPAAVRQRFPRPGAGLRHAASRLRAKLEDPENVVIALAAVATAGLVAAAVLTGEDRARSTAAAPRTVTETRTVTVTPKDTAPARSVASAPTAAPPPRSASKSPACELDYVVAVGDTLWGIAERHYVDGAAAMRRIKRRNALGRENVLAGETLVLPARGRTTPCPERPSG